MAETRQSLAKLESKHEETQPKQSSSQSGPETESDQVSDVLFRSGRSIAALQTAAEGFLTWNESGTFLHCSVCVPDPKDVKSFYSGVFKYDQSLGTSFDPREPMPKRFTSVRESVAKHFRSKAHHEARKAVLEREGAERSRTEADNNAAARVLRTAYLVLKKSLSHLLFEELVVLQHLNGASMGNINHSRMAMATARSAFCEATLQKLKEHISEQPCVSVLADKVTVARRTVDVTAVLTMVPEAEPEKLFQSFVVGAPVVQEHDGGALANDIKTSLEAVGVTKTEQIAAIGADGQYHHNSVPEKTSADARKGRQSKCPSAMGPGPPDELG